jgi:hypothetical protein
MHTNFSRKTSTGIDHLEELGVDEKIILEHTSGYGLDSTDSGEDPVVSSCVQVNEASGSIKRGELDSQKGLLYGVGYI